MTPSSIPTPPSPALVRFGSEICGDPRLATEREWLVTNGLGGYAMGTVSGALRVVQRPGPLKLYQLSRNLWKA